MTDRTIVTRLGEAFPAPSEATRERLHAVLVERSVWAGLLDIAYRTIDSPLGGLLLAATSVGLVRVAFESEGHDDVLARLAIDVGPRILHSPVHLDTVGRQLDEYFMGRRRSFELAIDLQLAHGFRRDVLAALREIPYGTTESYAAVAGATGHPRAVRAVGTACGRNPVPVVVPCHRVVRSDGSIGQYRGGVAAKRLLLELEAA